MASIGQELLNVPMGDMIRQMAFAIAEGQMKLDANSIATAQEMATAEIELGTEKYNLIALGFTPTFYSFTEATVEAKLSFSMTESTELGVTAGASVGVNTGFVMVAASVSVSYARKFSVSAEGMSSIAARLVSLPPPEILENLLRKMSEPPAPPTP